MITPHTQQTLDKLTWNEIQKLHSSLKLRATANFRTRRHLQQNIIAAQPQSVVELEAIVTPLTCATCPLARLIEDNRYCCDLTDTVVRGHWEGTDDCYRAVADSQPESEAVEIATEPEATEIVTEKEAPIAPEATEIITEKEAPIAPEVKVATIAEIPHAYREESLIEAMTKENPFQQRMNDLDYFGEQKMKAIQAIEATLPGTVEEAKAYRHLRKIERLIESCDSPAPEELADDVEPEGTIHWHDRWAGTIVGKKGAAKNFYIRSNGEIMIVISATFTASESKSPNIRHQQIRSEIESRRYFNPRAFKSSPSFERNTEACNGGRIRQQCDGHWWAWVNGGITGHLFCRKAQALQYLARVSGQN